jgi:hypothetical protein
VLISHTPRRSKTAKVISPLTGQKTAKVILPFLRRARPNSLKFLRNANPDSLKFLRNARPDRLT